MVLPLGVPERALGWFPLDFGIMEDKLSKIHASSPGGGDQLCLTNKRMVQRPLLPTPDRSGRMR